MVSKYLSVLLSLLVLAGTGAAFAQTYDIDWHTVDGGGHIFSTDANGVFELGGTIGQADAGPSNGPMTGSGFELIGGFWSVAAAPCSGFTRADANCDGAVDFFDLDAFILALLDPDAYAANYPGCNLLCANDVNEDGVADFFDIDPFIACLLNGGCP